MLILFLTIQFSINHLFALSLNSQTVQFDPQIGCFQVLPLQVRVNLRAMAMRGDSTLPKAPRLKPHHQIVFCHIQDICYEERRFYHSAEMPPADWTDSQMVLLCSKLISSVQHSQKVTRNVGKIQNCC